MSKIESGKLTLNMDQISLREVMDSIVSIAQRPADPGAVLPDEGLEDLGLELRGHADAVVLDHDVGEVRSKHQQFDVFIHDISTENVCCDSVRLNQFCTCCLSSMLAVAMAVMPTMAFMGVRMSWDMLERNSLLEQYIRELEAAMDKGEDYSALMVFGSERRHLQCNKLPYSEWYLVTVLPYGELDQAVSGCRSRHSPWRCRG